MVVRELTVFFMLTKSTVRWQWLLLCFYYILGSF